MPAILKRLIPGLLSHGLLLFLSACAASTPSPTSAPEQKPVSTPTESPTLTPEATELSGPSFTNPVYKFDFP
ncbi:MAG: hypothetical protein WCC12_17245, partial [Anaerolineales bacterium]